MSTLERTPVGELVDDLVPVMPFIGQWLINFCVDFGVYVIHPAGQLFRGQHTSSVKVLSANFFKTLGRYPLQLFLTVSSLLLNALASLINNTLLNSSERALTKPEEDYLRSVFANSIDYSVVRLQFGGVKEALRISPQAVANDIFMRQHWGSRTVYPDGSLTGAGLRLLGHEAAHVWQYQNTGAGYIGDSLMTQLLDFIGCLLGIRLSEGYDVRPVIEHKRSVDECNVEQQAVLAELIAATCYADIGSECTPQTFMRTCGFNLSEDEFAVVKQTRAWFMNSGHECN